MCIAPRGSSPHLACWRIAKKSAKQIELAGEAFQLEELRSSLCTKVKTSLLALIATWCEECGRKKRRKRWRNKRRGHSPSEKEEESQVSETEKSAVLENCVNKSKQKRREESKRKLWEIHGKRQWVKRKKRVFFTQVVSLSVIISV